MGSPRPLGITEIIAYLQFNGNSPFSRVLIKSVEVFWNLFVYPDSFLLVSSVSFLDTGLSICFVELGSSSGICVQIPLSVFLPSF